MTRAGAAASALAIPPSLTSSPTRQRKGRAARRPRAPTRCGTADVSEDIPANQTFGGCDAPRRHPARASGPVLCREPPSGSRRCVVPVRHRRSVPQRRRAAGHRRTISSCSPTTSRAVAWCPSTAPASRARARGENVALLLQRAMQHASLTSSRRWRGTRRRTSEPRGDGDGDARFGKVGEEREKERGVAGGRPGSAGLSRGSPCPITSRWRRACATRCGLGCRAQARRGRRRRERCLARPPTTRKTRARRRGRGWVGGHTGREADARSSSGRC